MLAKVFESIPRQAPMGQTMSIDTGKKLFNTVKDGKVDDYVADSYQQTSHSESFIPSIQDKRLHKFLNTLQRKSLGDGWTASKEYGPVAESGNREDGTYQAIFVSPGHNCNVVTLSTHSDGVSHFAKFDHVSPLHHKMADEFDIARGRVKPLGIQDKTLEEGLTFQAEVGQNMMYDGDKYIVTEYGLQEPHNA